MSDDLVKQLRVGSIWGQSVQGTLTNWRLERQEAADRIEQLVATNEELEEKILSATMDGYDMAKHEYRDRIEQLVATNEELEVKLAIADRLAEVLNDLLQNRGHCFIPNRIAGREDWDEDATEALKDFKGEKE